MTVLSGHFSFHRSPISFLSSALAHTLVPPTTFSTAVFRSLLGHQQAVSVLESAHVSQPSCTSSKQSDDAANESGWRLCARIGSYLNQLTCLGGAAGGFKGGRELALGTRGELGERVVVLGNGSDDGDGHGEEGLELHFGGWGLIELVVVVLLFGRLFE